MKKFSFIAVVLFAVFSMQAQPAPGRLGLASSTATSAAPAKDTSNYRIRVEWKDAKGETQHLEVLTAAGNFELNTIQKNSVKINNNDIPVTLRFNGTLSNVTDDKARLEMFLGRTVPYITGTTYSAGIGNTSSYSQMSVGQQVTLNVTFGKMIVIQSDENGSTSVRVERMKDWVNKRHRK